MLIKLINLSVSYLKHSILVCLTIIRSDERDPLLLPTTALYCIKHIEIYMATLWRHGGGGGGGGGGVCGASPRFIS